MITLIKCSCGYCTDSFDKIPRYEWDEVHSELDDNACEHFTMYSCPKCGDESLEKLYLDDDQEFFDDDNWHDCYSCSESCEYCNRCTFDECTREFKMPAPEWISERRLVIIAACNKAYDIISLIKKINTFPQFNQKGVEKLSIHKQCREMQKYLNSFTASDNEEVSIENIKRLVKRYRNDALLQEAVKLQIKLGALNNNRLDDIIDTHQLVERLMAA